MISGWLRETRSWIRRLLGKPEGEVAQCMYGWWRVIAVYMPPKPCEHIASWEWTVQAPNKETAIEMVRYAWPLSAAKFAWSVTEELPEFIPERPA